MLFASVASLACARATAPPPARATADAVDLHQLAADMDDPSAAPIWPMVPPELKALVAPRIPPALSPGERRRLGESWVETPYVAERCDGREPQEPFLTFLAGWYLLEDLAWSPASDQRAGAATALYERLRKEPFTSQFRWAMKQGLKSLRPAFRQRPEKLREIEDAVCLGLVRELIAHRMLALERHFGAQILRGAGSDVTAQVLRDEAARRSDARDFRRALPFAAAAAQLLAGSSDAWLELAKVSYQSDDVARGDDALSRALALGADGTSEPVRTATRYRILAHAPPPGTFEQSVARFWALFEMGRTNEARTLVDRLRRQRPNDARAFVGDIWLNYDVRAGAGEPFLDLAHTGFVAFAGAHGLTGQDQDFYRVYLALAFQEVLRPFMDAVTAQRPIGSDPAFIAAIARARTLSGQLAPRVPDAAALTTLSLDMLEAALPPNVTPPWDTRPALAQFFPRAQALYAAHPSAESYRFLLGLAMLLDDHRAAAAAIMAPLRFDPGGDAQLALARADAFVSVSARAKDWSALQTVSTLLAAVPRRFPETERELDLLRADSYLLRAVHGERALWRSAYSEYTHISWTTPSFEQDRASNNIVAIADACRPDGDTSHDWSDLRAGAGAKPPWPVLVNAAAATFRAGHREGAVAILRSRTPAADEQRPDFVDDWLACLEGTSPSQAARPPAGDQNVPVEVVTDQSKPANGADPYFSWQFSSTLNSPPARPTLQFNVSDSAPWLIASPRVCWAGSAVSGSRHDSGARSGE